MTPNDTPEMLRAEIGALKAELAAAKREADYLAKSLFRQFYSQNEDYASGRVTWELCNTPAGVITQIDNMVAGIIRKQIEAENALRTSEHHRAKEKEEYVLALTNLRKWCIDSSNKFVETAMGLDRLAGGTHWKDCIKMPKAEEKPRPCGDCAAYGTADCPLISSRKLEPDSVHGCFQPQRKEAP